MEFDEEPDNIEPKVKKDKYVLEKRDYLLIMALNRIEDKLNKILMRMR